MRLRFVIIDIPWEIRAVIVAINIERETMPYLIICNTIRSMRFIYKY